MSVPYLKAEIVFNDESKAAQVQSYLQGRLDAHPKAVGIGDGIVHLGDEKGQGDVPTGNKIVTFTVRFPTGQGARRTTVRSELISKAQEAGIVPYVVSAKLFKHECSHDESPPSACTEELWWQYPSP